MIFFFLVGWVGSLSSTMIFLGGAWAAAAFRTSARGATEAASPIITKLSAYMSAANTRAARRSLLQPINRGVMATFSATVRCGKRPMP